MDWMEGELRLEVEKARMFGWLFCLRLHVCGEGGILCHTVLCSRKKTQQEKFRAALVYMRRFSALWAFFREGGCVQYVTAFQFHNYFVSVSFSLAFFRFFRAQNPFPRPFLPCVGFEVLLSSLFPLESMGKGLLYLTV